MSENNSRRNFIKKVTAGGVGVIGADLISLKAQENKSEEPKQEPVLPKNPLNIIWITCDEMNTKAMSIYGNPFTSMPAAEQMAKEGVAFNHPYVQMPKSVPSRCSMISGRYPHCEGHRTLSGKKYSKPTDWGGKNDDFTLMENEPNLVKYLKDKGYKTALLGKNHLVDWNLHKIWFDYTSEWDSPEFKNRPYSYKNNVSDDYKKAYFMGETTDDFDAAKHPDSLCVNWAKKFMNENKDNPFLALVDIGLPHPVYGEFTDMPAAKIPLEKLPAPDVVDLDKAPSVEQWKRKSFDLEHFTDNDRKKIKRAYYTMCEFADRRVKDIIDEVDKLGLAENTLIIYSADHGDFNGDRNMFEKWDTSMTDEITKVPLLMRLPKTLPAGKRLDNLVEFVDIAPTIIELLGEDIPLWMQGKSLLDLAQGKTTEHKDAVFSQGGVELEATLRPSPYESYKNGKKSQKQKVVHDFSDSMARCKMIRMGDLKYVYRVRGDHELYDLKNDPKELVNEINNPKYKDELIKLKERMLLFTIESETNYPLIGHLNC